jgi:hypothetical protein
MITARSMIMNRAQYSPKPLLAVALVACGLMALAGPVQSQSEEQIKRLLPQVSAWTQSEDSQTYFPENLFEYINGAAEIYLSYDFQELIVAQYKKEEAESSMAVEIYDLGSPTNSFGIYSAERYPENPFLPIGVQGYLEEGSLNFLAGRYYVKLLCFDCADDSDGVLKGFAQDIVTRVGDTGGFPALLAAFPGEGLVANTEKYILNNVMGYAFLHSGYMANYELEGQAFDCFVIVGKDNDDAQAMLDRYLEAKGKSSLTPRSGGYIIKDKYYHNIYIGRTEHYLCGVMKIKDGFEKIGERYLTSLMKNLGTR